MNQEQANNAVSEALSLANARIAELERERKEFENAALDAVTAAQQDQEKIELAGSK